MKLKVLKLNKLNNNELNARRMNALKGGGRCACVCIGYACPGGVEVMEGYNGTIDIIEDSIFSANLEGRYW